MKTTEGGNSMKKQTPATMAAHVLNMTPIPGQPGVRRDASGKEFYSAAWLSDGVR